MNQKKNLYIWLSGLVFVLLVFLLHKAQVRNYNTLTPTEQTNFIENHIFYAVSGNVLPEKYMNLNPKAQLFFEHLQQGELFLETNKVKQAWESWNQALNSAHVSQFRAEAYFVIATSIGEQDGFTSFLLLQKALEITRHAQTKNRVLEYCCLNELVQMLVSHADDLSVNQNTDKLAKKYSLQAHELLSDPSFNYRESDASKSVYRIATESLFWLGEDSLAFSYIDELLKNKQKFKNPELVPAYADILKGEYEYIKGNYKTSEKLLKSAITTIGNKTSFLDYNLELPYAYLGAVYIKEKRYAEAIDFMEKSAKTLENEFYNDINEPLKFINSDALKKENSLYNIILCLLRLQHFYKEAINQQVESVSITDFTRLSAYTNELIRAWFLNAADESILLRATKLIKLSNGNDVDLIWNHKNKFANVEKKLFQLQTEASSFYLNYLIELRDQHKNNTDYEEIRGLTFELMNAEKDSLLLQNKFIEKRLSLLQLKSELWAKNKEDLTNIVFNNPYPKNLSDDEAVIKYFMSYTELYVTCITSKGCTIKKLSSENLKKHINEFQYAIKSKPIALKEQQFFYNLLIKPIIGELQHIKILTLLSDERLNGITFEVLQNEKEEFLIHNFSIKYSYSSKNVAPGKKPQINNIMAFAPGFIQNDSFISKNITRDAIQDCDFITDKNRREALSPIPSSKDEVVEIGKLFSQYNLESQVFTSSEATKKNLLAGATGKSLIHIATHGISKGEFNSGLFFTLHDKDNGFLSLQEIYSLNLDADLVVLSACKTGVGDIKDGEGIMALPRGFFCAGTKNIIASLWKVHDQKTKELMLAFYTHLLQDKVSYAEALRLAKLECIEKGFLPVDWAGFVLIGN